MIWAAVLGQELNSGDDRGRLKSLCDITNKKPSLTFGLEQQIAQIPAVLAYRGTSRASEARMSWSTGLSRKLLNL